MLKRICNCKSVLVGISESWIRNYSDYLAALHSILPQDLRPGSKRVLVIIAHGSEEMESVVVSDILRRAGVSVTVAGLEGYEPVKCSRRVVIKPDTSLKFAVKDNRKFDGIFLPGGSEGIRAIGTHPLVGVTLVKHHEHEGIFGVSGCAALILQAHNVARGKRVTAHPLTKNELQRHFKYGDQNIIIDDPVISCRTGPYIFDLGLVMAEKIAGRSSALTAAKHLFHNYKTVTLTPLELEQKRKKKKKF